MPKLVVIYFILFFLHAAAFAQFSDTASNNLSRISPKYVEGIDKKIKRYGSQLTNKTEKTLTRLSRWENKIHTILQKVNPEAANRLFGNNQVSFALLLQKLKQGNAMSSSYQATYNKYRDDLATGLKYLAVQKEQLDSGFIKKINTTHSNMEKLSIEGDQAEALQDFIKERKKQLAEQAFQYIGKSKYLLKINKEAYYYGESLKNYKELFSDSKKMEQTVKVVLNNIPSFRQFMRRNSQLAALFSQPDNVSGALNADGLQTRDDVQSLLQERIAAGGANALQQVQQNIQEAKDQVSKLKDRMQSGLEGGSEEIPDFKPNTQKTKAIVQRLEYDFNLQFAKSNSLLPSTSELALGMGYKINDKSLMGIGVSYKLGIGSIQHIRLTHQGIGLRSFLDWRLKKQFFISGGYEVNHNAQFKNIEQLKNYNAWQRSALIGVTKKVNIKTRWFKATNIRILYDFLALHHVPVTQPILFRAGYNF